MNDALDALLAPDVRPFAVAGTILIVLAGIEIVTTLAGFSVSHAVGKDLHLDADNALAGLILWINAGRVPFLILIFLALGVFSIEGYLLQGVAHGLGVPIPAAVASLAALVGSAPVIRVASRGIAKIIPTDETYAVDEADFVGRIAVVSVGPLDHGLPGRVRLKDQFGNWHNVAARADRQSPPLANGTNVLLVDRDARSFIAIAAPNELAA